jgi:prephenate dehydrogenase
MLYVPEKIAIYSTGLLGGSLGLALKHSGYKGKIIGLSSPRNLEIAKSLGCIDDGYDYADLQDVITDTDLLILCSPINSIIKTIEHLKTLKLPDGLIITDVGSTKQEIMNAAVGLPDHVRYTGGHPMAGSEKSGPSTSDPYLFQNAIYVLTPPSGTLNDTDRDFAVFLEKYLGCRTLFLDPGIHDKIAATVSHVPHLLAVALVCMAQEMDTKIPGTLKLAAGGFRDMTRIASASYDMWHDILMTNKSAIEPILDSLIGILTDIKSDLKNDSLREYFNRSGATRASIPLSNKGFINRLSEVLVHAKDQPGFIAALANVLSKENINIKDIEVLKVREGEGGTIRLAFENQTIARNAVTILTENGFFARERI